MFNRASKESSKTLRFPALCVLGIGFAFCCLLWSAPIRAQTTAGDKNPAGQNADGCVIDVSLWHKPGEDRLDQGRAKAAAPTVPSNTPIWIQVTLRNLGKEQVAFEEFSRSNAFKIEVRDAAGRPVRQTVLGTPPKVSNDPLAALVPERIGHFVTHLQQGDRMVRYFRINALHDMTTGGTYYVSVSREIRLTGTTVTSPRLRIDVEQVSPEFTTESDSGKPAN